MPDILHWLGSTKIDNMVSMSDMKYDAIVKSGIPIKKRYDLPGTFFYIPNFPPPFGVIFFRPPYSSGFESGDRC